MHNALRDADLLAGNLLELTPSAPQCWCLSIPTNRPKLLLVHHRKGESTSDVRARMVLRVADGNLPRYWKGRVSFCARDGVRAQFEMQSGASEKDPRPARTTIGEREESIAADLMVCRPWLIQDGEEESGFFRKSGLAEKESAEAFARSRRKTTCR